MLKGDVPICTFNGVNYGSIEAFAKHTLLPIADIVSAKQLMSTDSFENYIVRRKGVGFSKRLMFINGGVVHSRKELADLLGITPQALGKAIGAGKTIDDIVVPRYRHTLKLRLKKLNGNTIIDFTREEVKVLQGMGVSKTDADVIMRVFNLAPSETANFIRMYKIK